MNERTEAPMKKPNQPPTEAEMRTRTNKLENYVQYLFLKAFLILPTYSSTEAGYKIWLSKSRESKYTCMLAQDLKVDALF